MNIDYKVQEPIEDLVDQDENAIERSLEFLLADLGGSNGSLPVDGDMNVEAQRTLPNEEVTMQDKSETGDGVEEKEEEREEAIPRIEGDILDQSMSPATPTYRVEVVIPEMLPEERAEYSFVHSDIVESVLEEVLNDDLNAEYRVEFTDGREELVGGCSPILIQSAAIFACSLLPRGHIISFSKCYGAIIRSSALRHRGVNTLAIVNGLPYSLPTSQIYTPLLCSPAPLLILSRHSLALL
jgi:hypothetical protein